MNEASTLNALPGCLDVDVIRVGSAGHSTDDARQAMLDSVQPNELVNLLKRQLPEGVCRRLGLFDMPVGLQTFSRHSGLQRSPFVARDLRRVQAVSIPKEIVLVDDNSTDGTRVPAAADRGRMHRRIDPRLLSRTEPGQRPPPCGPDLRR